MNDRLYALGNLTIDDIVVRETGQMHLGSVGGDALFAAIGMRVWHEQVGVIARVGSSFPQENIARMKEAGIEPILKSVPHPDLHFWTLYEPGGVRQFVTQRNSGAYEDMSIRGEEIPDACLGAGGYHVAPMPTDIQASVVARLRQPGTLLSLDPHELYLAEPDLQRQVWDMLGKLDLFLPSREEAAVLHGSDDPQAAARAFAAAGVGIVAIKLGAQGSLLYVAQTDSLYRLPACEVEAVDPTGAGDSYCGGFLAGYLATRDPLLAACCGTVSASFVVQHVGALNTFQSDFSQASERLEQVRSRVKEIRA